MAMFLQKKGIDAHLSFDINLNYDLPTNHNPLLKKSSDYPNWIYQMEFPIHFFKNPLKYFMKERDIVKFMSKYDLIVCSGRAPIWARWSNRPFIFLSYGSDLDQLAVQGWTGKSSYGCYMSRKEKLISFITKHRMRDALKKANAILILPHQIETAKRLGLKRLRCCQHVVDTTIFKPMDDKERTEERERLKKELGCDLILFHPTRQAWRDREITDCKGNDKLFRAFAKFLSSTKKKVKLIAIEKGWDIESSKELVEELGIAENIIWKPSMERFKLKWYYNVADIVLDQFNLGCFGTATVEPMACETPVFVYFNPSYKDFFYGGLPPIVNVQTEEEIFYRLCELAEDENLRKRIGKDCYNWTMKYTHWEVATDKYIELFQEVLSSVWKDK